MAGDAGGRVALADYSCEEARVVVAEALEDYMKYYIEPAEVLERSS